jgi:hypothetical protein
MNDNTRAQWARYQESAVPCPDCAWLLYYLVADHNAATATTHPGYRRLVAQTRRSRTWLGTHFRHLERDGHIVLVREGKWRGGAHDAAAEYRLPWLVNPPASSVRNQTDTAGESSVRNQTDRRTEEPVDESESPVQIRDDKRHDKRHTPTPYGSTASAASPRAATDAVPKPLDCNTCTTCQHILGTGAACPEGDFFAGDPRACLAERRKANVA